jgi:hypothetical protein
MGEGGLKPKVNGVSLGVRNPGCIQSIGYYPAFGLTGAQERSFGFQERFFNDKTR